MQLIHSQEVKVSAAPGIALDGTLIIPQGAAGIVVFAHGSGSSRHSPRNRYVARVLHDSGLGTLLFDLLTPQEEPEDLRTGHLRFNIRLLSQRVMGATDWLAETVRENHLANGGEFRLGYFGASTGAAAALVAAAEGQHEIAAIVSRGGRPDLAGEALDRVKSPTLLIVGEEDQHVLELNRQAMEHMKDVCKLAIVPGATHLFEEPGTLEEAARLASDWFTKHLGAKE